MTFAIAKQRWPVVEYLQSKGLRLQHKRIALEYAALKSNYALAAYIIDNHLQHVQDPQRRWLRFRTPLREAVSRSKDALGAEKMFMLLLERSGQNFDPINNPLLDKKLLFKAARGNSLVILQKLWDLGCRNSIEDPRVISYAFSFGQHDAGSAVVGWLLDHGANPCVNRYPGIPIDIVAEAIRSRAPTAALMLIDGVVKWLQTHPPSSHVQQEPTRPRRKRFELHISRLNQKVEERQITSLHAAIEAGYIEVVKALLANGVDIRSEPR